MPAKVLELRRGTCVPGWMQKQRPGAAWTAVASFVPPRLPAHLEKMISRKPIKEGLGDVVRARRPSPSISGVGLYSTALGPPFARSCGHDRLFFGCPPVRGFGDF